MPPKALYLISVKLGEKNQIIIGTGVHNFQS